MTDLFHDIPGNPPPEGAGGGFFAARDGRRIRYGLFPASAAPAKGTVVVLTGRNECIEKYFETARDLAARGFASAVLDWRGQGGSDRLIRDPQRGYVKSFSDYAGDLDRFFGEVVLPDCRGPYYILAHSAGALVALLAAPTMVNRVSRMVLVAPFLGLPGEPVSMRNLRRLATLLTFTGFGRSYAGWGARPKEPPPFEGNRLTSDPVRFARNALLYGTHPRLALGGPTVRWLRAAGIAIEAVSRPDYMGGFRIPTLIVAAGADRVVSVRAAERYARHLRLASFLTIDGARHELLQEADIFREQFLAAFDAFIPGTGDGAPQALAADAADLAGPVQVRP